MQVYQSTWHYSAHVLIANLKKKNHTATNVVMRVISNSCEVEGNTAGCIRYRHYSNGTS